MEEYCISVSDHLFYNYIPFILIYYVYYFMVLIFVVLLYSIFYSLMNVVISFALLVLEVREPSHLLVGQILMVIKLQVHPTMQGMHM